MPESCLIQSHAHCNKYVVPLQLLKLRSPKCKPYLETLAIDHTTPNVLAVCPWQAGWLNLAACNPHGFCNLFPLSLIWISLSRPSQPTIHLNCRYASCAHAATHTPNVLPFPTSLSLSFFRFLAFHSASLPFSSLSAPCWISLRLPSAPQEFLSRVYFVVCLPILTKISEFRIFVVPSKHI